MKLRGWALVAFVVVDVILVVVMVGKIRDQNNATGPSSPSPTYSPTTPAAQVAGGPLTMSATGFGTLFVVYGGDCATNVAARVYVSSNVGNSFREMNLSIAALGGEVAKSVVAIAVTGRSTYSMMVQNSKCELVELNSIDAGSTWKLADTAFDWYISPDRKHVMADTTEITLGCTPLALAPQTSNAASVLCTTGTVYTTRDAGTSWSRTGERPGTRSLGVNEAEAMTLGSSPDCKSLVFRSEDSGANWEQGGCINASASAMALTQGLGRWFATDGHRLWMSQNFGDSWNELGRVSP